MKVFLIIITSLAIVYFGLSLYVANEMTRPFKTRIDINPTVIGGDVEDITFTTQDKITLHGWLFRGKSDKLVIMVSGLLENRTNAGYYGGFIASELIDLGYNVLLYDSRNFSTSSNKRVAYGSREGLDVLSAIGLAEKMGFAKSKIGIVSYSTGAISTLMVSDKLQDIGALIIDSAAADYESVVSQVLWREKNIPVIFHPAIFYFDKVLFGVDIANVRPLEAIKKVPDRTFLFLHAGKDETIPVEESKKLLSAANKKSRLVIFPKGYHMETYKSDPNLYRREVFEFLNQELSR